MHGPRKHAINKMSDNFIVEIPLLLSTSKINLHKNPSPK